MKKGTFVLALLGAALVGRATASPTVQALAKKWCDKGSQKLSEWKESLLKEDDVEDPEQPELGQN